MIIERIAGHIKEGQTGWEPDHIDLVSIEWYEASKKVLHKVSRKGVEVGIRNQGAPLREGDILWQEGDNIMLVTIAACPCLALKPDTMADVARACYEIGNRHAPLFIEEGELLTPYDQPLEAVLLKCGFACSKKEARLITPLGGYGHGHSHSH